MFQFVTEFRIDVVQILSGFVLIKVCNASKMRNFVAFVPKKSGTQCRISTSSELSTLHS